jgi:DNA-binding PadR family transcriptional regulator
MGQKVPDVSAVTPQKSGNSDTRRKVYQITPTGRSILSAELARLERLLEHARPALAAGEGPK